MRPWNTLRLFPLLFLPTTVVLAQPASSPVDEETAIREVVIESYVKGIHIDRDEAAIRQGFHPDFVMSVYSDGELVQVTLPEWIGRLPLGETNPHEIRHEFEKIDITGPAAQVRLALFRDGQRIYTDYFGLYQFPNGWKIVNKLFHSHR